MNKWTDKWTGQEHDVCVSACQSSLAEV